MEPNTTPSNINNQEDDSINIKRYLGLFISNWYLFAVSLFISMTIAYSINRYSSRIYTVSSTLMISEAQNSEGNRIVGSVIPGGDIFNNKANMTNEISILTSFSLSKRVIDSLPEFRVSYYGVGRRNIAETRMYKNSPFIVITDSADMQPRNFKVNIRIISAGSYLMSIEGIEHSEKEVKFGERYSGYGFNFIINIRDRESFIFRPDVSNKFYFYFSGSEELANNYRGALSVVPIDKDASIIKLTEIGLVPEQEADFLNMLMKVYRNLSLESKNQTAESTLAFIDRQLGIVSDSLKKAEKKLQKLRLENKLVDLSKDGTLLQGRLEKEENEKKSLDLQIYYFQYLKEYLDSKNESGDIVSPNMAGIEEPTLLSLVEELAIQQKLKKELSVNLSADLPPVTLASENINKIRINLSENIRSSLINIKHLVNEVNDRIATINSEAAQLPVTEMKRINIQRDFDINNTVYTYLLEKRAETGIAKASNMPDSKIIDEANILNTVQIKPTVRKNELKAVLIGLILPGLLIFLLYYLNNKIIDSADVVNKTTVPIIGYVSHNSSKIEIPVIDSPKSTLAESFRSIRTTLRYFSVESGRSVITVTSTISSEGKTFISINLAAITATLGKKVLLIGLDLRRPRIHELLGIDNNEGLSTYLSGNCEYEDVIKETTIKNLDFASSGPVPPNPAELIEDEKLDVFITKAKLEYDYIIIDTPPVAVVSDTFLIARFTDINLFVIRQRYTSKNTLELIQALYQEGRLKRMAIVMNDISLKGYYGYGIKYGYYKGYGYSYGKDYYGQYSYSKYGFSDKEHGYYNT
jgi:tyrosine-protein kinase Etk/Wzc